MVSPTRSMDSERRRDAVRWAYGARAAEYTELLGSADSMSSTDREAITAWARKISGRMIDAGCGPGHWTKHLYDHGGDVEGVDMVPEFVESARARFPDVVYRVGHLESLPAETNGLAGLLSWYSLIHTHPGHVADVLSEFARCLKPGGSLLLGFVEGKRLDPFDHAVVTAYRWPVGEMSRWLEIAGFEVSNTQTRQDPGMRPHAAITAELRA